jgi:solute carrier family 25 carnitine/acylcarnitine transporter 20/29
MASDFWAGYLSGAIGIIIGNPLDVIKVRLQAGAVPAPASTHLSRLEKATSLVRGLSTTIQHTALQPRMQ